ncbi:MAG: hypothetical protein RJA09_228 [Pseudomonadota bacterium]
MNELAPLALLPCHACLFSLDRAAVREGTDMTDAMTPTPQTGAEAALAILAAAA